MAVRVLIVDDDAAFRRIARTFLAERGYDVAGEAETVAQARGAIRDLCPDALLLDVHLPDGSGITFADELAASHPVLRVLLTSSDEVFVRGDFVAKTELFTTDLAL